MSTFRQETVSGGEVILIAGGPITGEAVQEFQHKIDAVTAGRPTLITLDLGHCPAMNSEAIGKLLSLRKRLAEQGKQLRIQGCSDQLFSLFKTIRMDSLIPLQK